MRNYEYNFKKVIFGGSVESLLYSYINGLPILIKEPLVPFEFDLFDRSYDLKFLGYDTNRQVYKSEAWDRLSFLLSMGGLIMLPNIIKSYRDEDSVFVGITQNNKKIKINYDKKIDFDLVDESNVSVYDWFDVRSGCRHEYDVIEDPSSDFINKLIFYPSKRPRVNKNNKDLVSISEIRTDDLLDYEYAEGYARLKVIKMMKSAGIRGTANGYHKSGHRLYYDIRVEHSQRDIVKKYIPHHSLANIMDFTIKQGPLCNLTKKLFRHRQTSTLPELFRLQVRA